MSTIVRNISLTPTHDRILRELGIRNVSKYIQHKILADAKDSNFIAKYNMEVIQEKIRQIEKDYDVKIEYTLVQL